MIKMKTPMTKWFKCESKPHKCSKTYSLRSNICYFEFQKFLKLSVKGQDLPVCCHKTCLLSSEVDLKVIMIPRWAESNKIRTSFPTRVIKPTQLKLHNSLLLASNKPQLQLWRCRSYRNVKKKGKSIGNSKDSSKLKSSKWPSSF